MLTSVLGLLVVIAIAAGTGEGSASSSNASSNDSSYTPAIPLVGTPAQKLPAEEFDKAGTSALDNEEDANNRETQDESASSSEPAIAPAVVPPEGSAAVQAPELASKLVVRYLDVGQGDCALISCEGHHMLIDGGPAAASQKVFSVLKNLGIDYLDYIVATHADADHIGGISAALNAAKCGVCYCSVEVSDTRTFESMTRYVKNSGAPFVIPDIPLALELGNATISIIGPVQAFPESDNNGSLICRINYGTTSFLFMGDAEEEAEESLVSAGVNLEADVIKIGHHGSSHSTTAPFIVAVNPQYAIISVGADNPYGHPTERVLNLLQGQGIDVFRTDTDGDIIAISDGETINIRATTSIIDE